MYVVISEDESNTRCFDVYDCEADAKIKAEQYLNRGFTYSKLGSEGNNCWFSIIKGEVLKMKREVILYK